MHQDALPPESVDVFCYSKNLRGVMRNLVYQLLAECIDLRLKPMEQEKRRRFKALRMGDQMYGLFFDAVAFRFRSWRTRSISIAASQPISSRARLY